MYFHVWKTIWNLSTTLEKHIAFLGKCLEKMVNSVKFPVKRKVICFGHSVIISLEKCDLTIYETLLA